MYAFHAQCNSAIKKTDLIRYAQLMRTWGNWHIQTYVGNRQQKLTKHSTRPYQVAKYMI